MCNTRPYAYESKVSLPLIKYHRRCSRNCAAHWPLGWHYHLCLSFPIHVVIRCSVAQSCPTLCDPMDYSTPGFPALTSLPEFAQTHVH